MVSRSCGATGMAALAVEARMLRYQITIVSSTVGSTSFTNLTSIGQMDKPYDHYSHSPNTNSLATLDKHSPDPSVTSIAMATSNVDLHIAVLTAEISQQNKASSYIPAS